MSEYLALYRKWRPSVFADVIGQDHITKVLRSEVTQKSVSHAYLFCGSRGTGKTTCAKILAKAVSCENPVNGDPCGKCPSCLAFDKSLDITEMDAASNNSVNDIRDLRERISFMPIELPRRVYIIDEVHMLSNSAFNALLKTLEEPPAHVMFILATTELNKIPATILSRCKRFDFHRISPDDMMPRLQAISEAENIGIDDSALRLVARLATGAMRDALSMLELFVGQTDINREKAAQMLGVIGNAAILQLLESIANKDSASALTNIAESYKNSKDMSVLCSELSEMFRNLLIMKYASSSVSSLVDEGEDVITVLRNCEEKFSPERLLYCTEVIADTQSKLSKTTLSRKMLIELMVMRLCDSKLSTSSAGLLERISALESRSVGSFTPAPTSKPAASTTAPTQDTPQDDMSYLDDLASQVPSDTDFGFTESTNTFEKADVTPITETTSPQQDTQPTQAPKPNTSTANLRPMSAFPEVLEDLKVRNMMFYSLVSQGRAYVDGEKVILKLPSIAKFMASSDANLKNLLIELCSSKLGFATQVDIVDLPAGEVDTPEDLDNL